MTTPAELGRPQAPAPSCPHCGQPMPPPSRPARTWGKTVVAALALTVSAVYLLNLGCGTIFELPDVLPIIGNMDEAAATWLLFSALGYFGIDLMPFRRRP